ncbi:galactose oxidase [Hortaea werneckii]|nr:galactose oxidase [Hortaea werneckii]KAI7106843.1 galactose oxidase [Hortaea werneckii]KAI7245369.1 galactose oxidase [Hortaea werneckii]KAI7337424.1 galactose oxidase [Hortaea werneckii]KAI7393392.1 galactose oxidase [Hortaea werneckii]
MKATWTKIAQHDSLKRSSHSISVIGESAYIFGGELRPRQPRDNALHQVKLAGQGDTQGIESADAVRQLQCSGDLPSPRVGSASCTLHGKIYFFSGRGGEAMAPIDEAGSLWEFDPNTNTWASVKPCGGPHPPARSYHTMTSDGGDTIYLHAGCPEKGRLSDLWSFNISTREWRELAQAPNPPRGGPSIALANSRLYRMNGFDGKTEQGGAIDVYDPAQNCWESIDFQPDGKQGPGARSVAALLPVTIASHISLVTLFGESDPSSLGHQGAGKMLSDVWAYSLCDKAWSQVAVEGTDLPAGRGWFDADVVQANGRASIVVAGGLGESNDRLDDAWLLSFA